MFVCVFVTTDTYYETFEHLDKKPVSKIMTEPTSEGLRLEGCLLRLDQSVSTG
jgi:hypothetical protein